MRGTIFDRLRCGANGLLRDRRGNALILTAAAIIPVIGIIGSSVDIGRAYMAKTRLQQACDAGVLAGRRAMAAGKWSAESKNEADKMFAFNYPSDIYGSSQVQFAATASSASDVSGTARAFLPSSVMHIWPFGHVGFDLAVACTAKLEISNTDVMLVLDVTGSMSTNTSDGKSRISALKDAAMVFFDTLTTAEAGDGRLRIGAVPYSSAANVGDILIKENPAWVSDHMLLPSRSAMMRYDWGSGNPPTSVTNGTTTNGSWENLLVASVDSSSRCSDLTPPADSMPARAANLDPNKTTYIVDRNGTRRYVNDAGTDHRHYNYRYTWTGGRCVLQRRTVTFTHSSSSNPTSTQFYNYYRYEDRVFDVRNAKTGGMVTADTGDAGASRSYSWGGCLVDRYTTDFSSSSKAPASALDMDVDMVPTDDQATKWQMLIPELAFPRARNTSTKPSTTGVASTHKDSVSSETSSNGSWQNFSRYSSNGWAVCPAKAMKLKKMEASDRGSFQTYINSLEPLGGTYHDAGMVWGVRLLSPTGLFASENATAPNNRPIGRHIIFMTDGDMSPNVGNLTFQGYEYLMQRVGGSINVSASDLEARHNNRFVQLCSAAKDRNITVWVIGFGTALNDQLNACATPGKAYQTGSAQKLKEIFQSIAGQISKLRLSQ